MLPRADSGSLSLCLVLRRRSTRRSPHGLRKIRLLNLVHDMLHEFFMKTYFTPPCPDTTDLLHGSLRPQIPCPHHEDDAIDKLKSVAQHQALHLPVVRSAPMGARQKRPADLNFSLVGVISEVDRKSTRLNSSHLVISY